MRAWRRARGCRGARKEARRRARANGGRRTDLRPRLARAFTLGGNARGACLVRHPCLDARGVARLVCRRLGVHRLRRRLKEEERRRLEEVVLRQ